MISVKSKALEREILIEREIGRYGNKKSGPTVVIFAGIHGNEPSGIFALKEIFNQLQKKQPEFRGELIALSGNNPALAKGERYIENDLNRVWHADIIRKIRNGGLNSDEILPDIDQLIEIYQHIEKIFKEHEPPYYFLDLHTTSSDSVPFVTLNDTLRNRRFAKNFPIPVILGIEEFLSGTLMSYVNELGPIAMGFEAGNHDVLSSIQNHESFVWLSLVHTGNLSKEDVPDFNAHYRKLASQSMDSKRVFEIRYRHERTEKENFIMQPGYENFHPIQKGELLASNSTGNLYATEKGRIFLPLYQDQGDDGYFIIREIRSFWLKVSAAMRTYNFEGFLKVLPGIQKDGIDPQTFRVNLKIAKWFVVELFHLMGYRRSSSSGSDHYFTRRKYDTKEPEIYSDKDLDPRL